MTPQTKTCSKCRTEKPVDGFVRHRGMSDGRNAQCKDCVREKRGCKPLRSLIVDGKKRCSRCCDWKPRDEFGLRSDRPPDYLRSACRACASEAERPHKSGKHRFKRYGIGASDYARMVAEQGGHCAMCGGDPDKRGLVVDHDHESGAIRSLLCNQCNTGIGMFRESRERLGLAIAYLNRFAQRGVTT